MERFLSRVVISLAAAVAAIIFAGAAVGFLGAALYLALLPVMPQPFAALVVGLVGLLLAGLIILVARLTSRRRPAGRRISPADAGSAGSAGDVSDIAAAFGGFLARELTSRTQAHPYRAFAVALLAGLAVGISPELRDILKGGSKK